MKGEYRRRCTYCGCTIVMRKMRVSGGFRNTAWRAFNLDGSAHRATCAMDAHGTRQREVIA